MASAGKNHRTAPKTNKGTYGKQIGTVRKNFSVGEILTIDILKSRFPAIFPGNGPNNVGKFIVEARRKGHLSEDNALLAPDVPVKESFTAGSSPASNGIDEGSCHLNPADDAVAEVALFWDGEPFKKGDRFKAGQLRQQKPFFQKYYAASIGQFLLELSKKNRPLLFKNADGTWSLTEEGLKRQRGLRASRAASVSSPVKPTEVPVKSTAVEAVKPRLPAPVAAPVAVAAVPVKKATPVVVSTPKKELSMSPVTVMSHRAYNTAQKFVKLLSICRRRGINVITYSVISQIFKEFGEYKNAGSLSATLYIQSQSGRIFEALDSGGYWFRADYIAAVDSGFYGGDAVAKAKPDSAPIVVSVPPESIAEEEPAGVEAVEPLSEEPEPESQPDPDLEIKPALPPAESHDGAHSTKREPVTRRVSRPRRLVTSLNSAMQGLDEARKTVEGLSALVEGFPQKVQEIVGAALAAQAQRFETQLEEQRKQHSEQVQAQREQIEALRRLEENSRSQLIRERLVHARDVSALQEALEAFCTLRLSQEVLRRDVNLLFADLVDLGEMQARLDRLEGDFETARDVVELAQHIARVAGKLHK